MICSGKFPQNRAFMSWLESEFLGRFRVKASFLPSLNVFQSHLSGLESRARSSKREKLSIQRSFWFSETETWVDFAFFIFTRVGKIFQRCRLSKLEYLFSLPKIFCYVRVRIYANIVPSFLSLQFDTFTPLRSYVMPPFSFPTGIPTRQHL